MFNGLRHVACWTISGRVFSDDVEVKVQVAFSQSKPGGDGFISSVHVCESEFPADKRFNLSVVRSFG